MFAQKAKNFSDNAFILNFQLYYYIETTNKCFSLRMTRMDMD